MVCRVVSVSGVGSGGRRLAHTIPGDVNTAIFSNGELSATNGAHGHGGVWLSVNLDRFGKFGLARFAADVKNVSGFRVAFEVNQVNDAFGVSGRLWLDAVVWGTEQADLFASGTSNAKEKQDDGSADNYANRFHA